MHRITQSTNPRDRTGQLARVVCVILVNGTLMLGVLMFVGCNMAKPLGAPIQAPPLGSVVDEANRIQEENAEFAKLIVYTHEFELNQPREHIDAPWSQDSGSSSHREARGFRLNDYGMDHVKRIARQMQSGINQVIVVERSESSRRWDTLYQYPVHTNPELDEQRRQVVVAALESLGVTHADELVIVATAFPAGQHSTEASQAYTTAFGNSSQGSGQGASQGAGQGAGQGGGQQR